MREVLLCRHAQSHENAGTHTPGSYAHIRITELGKVQAQALGRFLRDNKKVKKVVSSPFTRALETAQIVCGSLDKNYVEWPVEEFHFISTERWEGMRKKDRDETIQSYWEQGNPHARIGKEGESFEEFMVRLTDIEKKIKLSMRLKEGPLLIVSHGYVMRGLILRWLFATDFNLLPLEERMQRMHHFNHALRIYNTAILKARFDDDGRVMIAPLDISHLSPELITY